MCEWMLYAPCACNVHKGQRVASEPLELELQAAVGLPMWVLGTEPGSPAEVLRNYEQRDGTLRSPQETALVFIHACIWLNNFSRGKITEFQGQWDDCWYEFCFVVSHTCKVSFCWLFLNLHVKFYWWPGGWRREDRSGDVMKSQISILAEVILHGGLFVLPSETLGKAHG